MFWIVLAVAAISAILRHCLARFSRTLDLVISAAGLGVVPIVAPFWIPYAYALSIALSLAVAAGFVATSGWLAGALWGAYWLFGAGMVARIVPWPSQRFWLDSMQRTAIETSPVGGSRENIKALVAISSLRLRSD